VGGHNIKIDNSSFERVEQFEHLETNLTNQNSVQEKVRADCSQGIHAIIRCRIFCVSVCYPKNTKIKIHRTVVLPVVLYGCETWSLTLRKERRLRVFANRALRIVGNKRDEVTEGVEELNEIYSSPNIVPVIKSRRMRWVGQVASMGERKRE
jgi:hypothetical protein